ncbi:MAG: DNA polymerase Y family protein [Betaproteobacteria bacterium]|nr:DNA polymerase Y family protein [Betaproteobacteria bacterium]
MLWTCLNFPSFSMQLALRGGAVPEPLVIASGGRRPEILSCNPAALQHGIRPGMSVSAALALAPRLIERPRDPAAEAQALQNLALWAGQFTPSVSLQAPGSLLLEVEGCLRLFGGLRALNARIQSELEALGYKPSMASAPTPAAAWLFARAGIATTLLDRHELKRALAPLPLSLLNQPPATLEKLGEAGVRTFGECLKLPRDGLGRRFGQGLLDEMDRTLGKLPDPRGWFVSPARYKGRLLLPAPVAESEALLFALKRLVLELCGFLLLRNAGVTRLKVELQHEDHPTGAFVLGLSVPSRDATRIVQLLRERLHAMPLRDRVQAIVLQSEEIAALSSRNLTLFPDDQGQEEERLMLVEHLRARLGVENVHGVTSFPDHRPEYAFRREEPGKTGATTSVARRPLWLLNQPRLIARQGEQPSFGGPLTLTTGPERIESGWWDGGDIRRDYFTASNEAGETLWIYRDRGAARGWYVHGLFA